MPCRTLTGWLLDLVARPTSVDLVFRTDDGGTHALSAPFLPSFVVAGRGVRREAVLGAARQWGCRTGRGEGIEFFSGRPVPAWRLRVPASGLLARTVRMAEAEFSSEALFNADIPPEQQFACATGLYPLARARVEVDDDAVVRNHELLDDPWDVDAPLPELTRATLKAEGSGHPAHGRIRPLLFSCDGRTDLFEWTDGAGLLRDLSRRLRDADPDLLVTEYGDDHLVPALLALADRCRVPFSLDRPLARPAGGPGTACRPRPPRSYMSYGKVVYRAATCAAFGRWHVDARNSFLFGDTGLPGLIELSRLSGIPLQRLSRSSPGTAISAMEVALAMSRGILVPFKKREPEEFKTGLALVETDKGGLTYLPRPGVRGNVAELDFASMYPSLMDRYNISPETIDCGCCDPGLPVPGIGAHTCARRRGIIPDTLAPILEKRRQLKARQKSAASPPEKESFRRRQTALKWLLVVSFGFLGYRNARFGRIEAHEAVTAWGREKLLLAKEIAERDGYAFLHGLTDAIWVTREGAAEEDYLALGDAITQETGMPIALEGVYDWIAFLPSRQNPSVAVPNRFAGLFRHGEAKVRGIALRRSDTPPFVAALQQSMIDAMAGARSLAALRALRPKLETMVEDAVRELRDGRVPPEALVIARRLSKAPDQYVANTAAAAVTRELCGRGVALQPGTKIRYLLTADRAAPARGRRGGRPETPQGGRALGFLDGSESADLGKYEELLREAGEELLWIARNAR
jgi:DNA polymerase-2